MNFQRNEEISAIYLVAIESENSVREHKKIYRFLTRNKPGAVMALYAHEVLVSSYDENNNHILRKLELPVIATTILDREKFLLYDDENALMFFESDLVFVSEGIVGPLELECFEEVEAMLEKMRSKMYGSREVFDEEDDSEYGDADEVEDDYTEENDSLQGPYAEDIDFCLAEAEEESNQANYDAESPSD